MPLTMMGFSRWDLMMKYVLLAAILLLVGGLLGFGIERIVDDRHRQSRAVMELTRFHLEKWRQAAVAKQCPQVLRERASLQYLDEELVQAWPAVYARDAEFRQRADALKTAVQGGDAQCADNEHAFNAALAACDQCHREYR